MNYKLIISGNKLYKEIIIPEDKEKILIGSAKDAQIRLPEDSGYTGSVATIEKSEDCYTAKCLEGNYIRKDEDKVTEESLHPGDRLKIFKGNSTKPILQIDLLFDFGKLQTDYSYQIDISDRAVFTIGGTGSDIVLRDELIGEEHCIITRVAAGYEIDSTDLKYGLFINGVISKANVSTINEKDFLKVYGVDFYLENGKLCTSKKLVVTTNLPATQIRESNNQFNYPEFIKNVRLRYVQPQEKMEVLQPQPAPQKQPWTALFSMLPMLVMMLAMMIMRSNMMGSAGGNGYMIMYGCMYGVSALMSIAMFILGRKDYKKKSQERIEKYNEYIHKKDVELLEERRNEKTISEKMNYLSESMVDQILSFDARLFEKEKSHSDFLDVPIGRGTVDAVNQVAYRENPYYETEDPLMNYPQELSEKYKKIADMPIILHLNTVNAVGFVGVRDRLCAIARNLLITIAGQHYYEDVKFFFLMEKEDVNDFVWIRWLQNITDAGRRNVMYDQESKKIVLDAIYNEISAREDKDKKDVLGGVHYIVFAYRTKELMEHPITNYVNKAKDLGFTFLFFDEYKEHIHADCDQLVYLDRDMNKGFLQKADDAAKTQSFEYNEVSIEQAKAVAKKLACVHVSEVSLESTLTKNISFFQMYKVLNAYDLNIGARWAHSKIFESMSAPIGVDSAGKIVALDIHEKGHGPHGLVAGTTGAGKSELLQTYILSMAAQFHPYEVSFIIIDFKGGGMANQFKNLPHLNGAITNIDGKQVNRSLMSIKAELMRRQRLFAEAGVNAIDNYIDMYKKGQVEIPLPHLILIVDEFAELKSDQPEFMKELISAARIGRSLGVHLILATQKPSGVVNDQIWSNSRFKLCLKVQDKQDSNEVLKSPLAAEIREPGRCYMEVGNHEIFQLLQSAYSGGPAVVGAVDKTSKFDLSLVNMVGARKVIFHQEPKKEESSMTQLEAIVSYISEYCEKNKIANLAPICLPPLPERIPYPDAKTMDYGTNDIVVPIGMYDDPENQVQDAVWLNLTTDNTFIIGSSLTGKTNLMQVIIRGLTSRYRPDEASIYIVDFASMMLKNYSSLNYVGGVVTIRDDTMLRQLLLMVVSMIDERQKILADLGLSSFAAYREAGYKDFNQVVIIVENYGVFRSTFEGYEETFLDICRDGLSVGISVVVTNPTVTGIGYKILTNFSRRISFFCNDSDQYSSLFERNKLTPDDVKGRAIINTPDGIREFQTYLSFDAQREIDRIEMIRKYVKDINSKCENIRARRIPTIPEVVNEKYLVNNYGEQDEFYNMYEYPVGISYSTIEPLYIRPMRNPLVAIQGSNELGRMDFIKYLISTMEKYQSSAPVKLYVIDDMTRELEYISQKDIVAKYSIIATDIVKYIEEVCMEVDARYDALAENANYLDDKPMLVIVINTPIAMDVVVNDDTASKYYDLITNKLKGCKACIMHTNVDNSEVTYATPQLLKELSTNAAHLVFEEIKQVRNIEILPSFANANAKKLSYGDAFYIDNSGAGKIKAIT
ncbi:type VII secretion protein EssC [Pseudobutyrivibrio sp.]|uniref:type VII secretion protein EssC n=1 Tax=Pseudobutyrivibrio sp. TaxID=2014367 RepID=UPI001DE2E87C|nr:type VII secretion protein EssC [Pseudobutyrivibrio sp.]MBE5910384.1 type VII secretion protein EssC [Pseudobutyrivibrio sp.]